VRRRSARASGLPEKVERDGIVGSVWTWTAMGADTKLNLCWLIGTRDAGCAPEFIQDLAGRLANCIQLTTDALRVYLNAIYDAFENNIDYATSQGLWSQHAGCSRYSPAQCIGCEKNDCLMDSN
jgi:hypothetical protein